MKTDKLAKTYPRGKRQAFSLEGFRSRGHGTLALQGACRQALQQGIARTAELQDKLYAQDNWALLLIFRPWMLPERTASSST